MDIVDPATRSRMMSGIRSTNTRPEVLIRSALHRQGFRFRLHRRDLPGKPDIVLPRFKAVVFVHGCFWHGHDCRLFKLPETRSDFWKTKIARNRSNDDAAKGALLAAGWRVATVWECSIRGANKKVDVLVEKLSKWIRSSRARWEARE